MLEALPESRGAAFLANKRYYYTGIPCINGHLSARISSSGKCLICYRESARIRKSVQGVRKPSTDPNNRKINHVLSNSIEMMLWISAKNRARKKGLEFTIKPTDIHIPEFCPVFGIKINSVWGGREMNNYSRANTASLDRIDPRKGYLPDNIIVMSYRANIIKGDGLPGEHRKVSEFILRHQSKR